MKTHTHGNGNGLDDLYILPDNHGEQRVITRWLLDHGIRYQWSYSNVEGQDWHGSHFIEIPFGERHAEGLQHHLENGDLAR